MANPYSAVFRDDNADTRLAGSVDFTDPTNQPGAVTSRAIYEGNAVTIADASNGVLTWNTLDSGDALLNLTVPSLPTIVTAGVYAFAVSVFTPVLTAGGAFAIELILDPDNEFADPGLVATPALSPGPQPHLSSAITYYMAAGAKVRLVCTNFDGAATRDFTLNSAVIQRLS